MRLREIDYKWREVCEDLETLLHEARKCLDENRYSGEIEKEQLEAHAQLLANVINLIYSD